MFVHFGQNGRRCQASGCCELTLLVARRKGRLLSDRPPRSPAHTVFLLVVSAPGRPSFDQRALSPRRTQAARRLLANNRAPYVFYGGHQAAAVSPQSVGLEASLAPLRCYASPAWLGAASGGRSAAHSRCTRRRCRWGSAGVKAHRQGSERYRPLSGRRRPPPRLLVGVLHPQFQRFSDGRVVIPRARL